MKKDYLELKQIDSQDMYSILKNFPEQVREAVSIGKSASTFIDKLESETFLIAGMGGSAIGGDLVRSYSAAIPGADHLNITVNRTYKLPRNIDKKTNIILSSYSGGTEETLAAEREAIELSSHLICITTGGSLGEEAAEHGFPKITIPGGMQPRCAIGYSFFPMLYVFINSGAYKNNAIRITEESIDELISLLDEKSKLYSNINDEQNPAIALAEALFGTAPVIYSSGERLDTVNLRWRGQFHENAKNFAFGSLLPEMNHNEVNSWANPPDMKNRFSIIFLRDCDDHERVKIRFSALQKLLKERSAKILSYESNAKTLLARMFDLIYLGDWASFYLSLLNKVDPTPIPFINELKDILSES